MKPRKKVALYGFSADPITFGHLDIINRASDIFDEVHVVIFNNRQKNYQIKESTRMRLVRETLKGINRVKIQRFDGLLVDYAFKNQIDYLIRGIRNITDLNFEFDLHYGNKSLLPNLETLYLPAKPHLTHISSSLTKLILKDMGNVLSYVPVNVKQAMEQEILGQFRISVTGGIASGKTEVLNKLVPVLDKMGHPSAVIDLDAITAGIYSKLDEDYKYSLFAQLTDTFGRSIQNKNKTIDRKALSKIIFSDPTGEKLRSLNELMTQPLRYEIRKSLKNKEGIVFISGAILAERNMLYLSNNNVLFIKVSEKTQLDRLKRRDNLNDTGGKKRIEFAGRSPSKLKHIKAVQEKDQYGKTLIMNNDRDLSPKVLEKLAKDLLEIFPDYSK